MLSCKQERSVSNHLTSRCLKETCMLHVWKKNMHIIYIYMKMEARRSAVTPRPQWGGGGWLTPTWGVIDSLVGDWLQSSASTSSDPFGMTKSHKLQIILVLASNCTTVIFSVLQGLYIDRAWLVYIFLTTQPQPPVNSEKSWISLCKERSCRSQRGLCSPEFWAHLAIGKPSQACLVNLRLQH